MSSAGVRKKKTVKKQSGVVKKYKETLEAAKAGSQAKTKKIKEATEADTAKVTETVDVNKLKAAFSALKKAMAAHTKGKGKAHLRKLKLAYKAAVAAGVKGEVVKRAKAQIRAATPKTEKKPVKKKKPKASADAAASVEDEGGAGAEPAEAGEEEEEADDAVDDIELDLSDDDDDQGGADEEISAAQAEAEAEAEAEALAEAEAEAEAQAAAEAEAEAEAAAEAEAEAEARAAAIAEEEAAITAAAEAEAEAEAAAKEAENEAALAAAAEQERLDDLREQLELNVEEMLLNLENMDLFTPADIERVQELTDQLMDALDAAHEHGGLEDSATIKEGDRKLIECEDTLTRLERQSGEVEEHRQALKEFTANYKSVVADIDEYKPLTAIKMKLAESMQALTNAQTDDAEEVNAAAKQAIAAATVLLDAKIAKKEELEEQQANQDPEAKKYFSEIDNMVSVIVKPREVLDIDLGILEAKNMLRWKILVKAEAIKAQVVLNRSDGKPSMNLVAPRNIKPNVLAKGLVYVPYDGQIIVSLNNKASGKMKSVSYSMVFENKKKR